jgi:hypothetical protein
MCCAYKSDGEKDMGKILNILYQALVYPDERKYLRTLPAHIRVKFQLNNDKLSAVGSWNPQKNKCVQLLCPSCRLVHFVLRDTQLHQARSLTIYYKAWDTIQYTSIFERCFSARLTSTFSFPGFG